LSIECGENEQREPGDQRQQKNQERSESLQRRFANAHAAEGFEEKAAVERHGALGNYGLPGFGHLSKIRPASKLSIAQASAALRFGAAKNAHNDRMRLLPLIATLALIFGGCSAGAGMQATPPAPISQSVGTPADTASSHSTTNDSAENAAADAVDSAAETDVPTTVSGAFLRA
jgi:hypothetical protein